MRVNPIALVTSEEFQERKVHYFSAMASLCTYLIKDRRCLELRELDMNSKNVKKVRVDCE